MVFNFYRSKFVLERQLPRFRRIADYVIIVREGSPINMLLCLVWLTTSLLLTERQTTSQEFIKEILMKQLTTIPRSYIKHIGQFKYITELDRCQELGR